MKAAAGRKPSPAKKTVADADSICILDISGMTCGACAAHVKKALLGVKEVKVVSVSYGKKQAVVKVSKPSAKEKSLVDAVEEAGYGASVSSKDAAPPVEKTAPPEKRDEKPSATSSRFDRAPGSLSWTA